MKKWFDDIEKLPKNATADEVREALLERSGIKTNQICKALKISKKGRKATKDVPRIMAQPLDKVIKAYNDRAHTHNERWARFRGTWNKFVDIWPEIKELGSWPEAKEFIIKQISKL